MCVKGQDTRRANGPNCTAVKTQVWSGRRDATLGGRSPALRVCVRARLLVCEPEGETSRVGPSRSALRVTAALVREERRAASKIGARLDDVRFFRPFHAS